MAILIGEDGKAYDIPDEHVAEAQANGFTLETKAQADARARAATLSGPIGAAASVPLGLLRGLTLGGSDFAIRKGEQAGILPQGSTQTVSDIKDLNPQGSTLGELGSFAVPGLGELAAAKGSTALAKVLKGASSAQRGATGAGTVIEKAAQKIIGENIAGKLVGGAARGIAEAELYNIGHNLSEDSLGDKELSVESLLAHSGEAAAVGAGLGFGIPAAGIALQKTVQKAKAALDSLGGFVRDALPSAAGAASETVINMAAKAGQAAGALREALANPGTEAGLAMRESIFKGADAARRDELMQQFQSELKQSITEVNEATHKGNAIFKKGETAKLLEDTDFGTAWNEAVKLSSAVKSAGEDILSDPLTYKGIYGKELAQISKHLDAKLADATTAHEVFEVINDTKKVALNDLSEWKRNLTLSDRDVGNSLNKVRDVYRSFASHLEDANIYGEAAARQQAYNEALATHLTAMDALRKELMVKKTVKGGVEYVVDSKKVNTLFNQIGSARGDMRVDALNQFLSSAHDVLDQVERSSVLGGAEKFDKTGLQSLLKKTAETRNVAQNELEQVNKLRALDNGMAAILHSPLGAGGIVDRAISSPATVAGAMLGGVPGAMAGSVVDAGIKITRNPIEAVKTLAKIEAFTLRTGKQISNALDGYIEKGSALGSAAYQKAKPFIGPFSVQALYNTSLGDGIKQEKKIQQSKIEQFRKQRTNLAQLIANPPATLQRFTKGLERLQGAAPTVAAQTAAKQMQVIQYLYEKMPKNPNMPLNAAQDRWVPSSAELSKYERVMMAATKPLSILSDLDRGTLTKDSVDTVKDLYPKLYADMLSKVTERVAQSKKPLPYSTITSLSILMGVPLDSTLQPKFIAQMQATFGPQDEQKQTSRRPLELNTENSMSATDRVASRK